MSTIKEKELDLCKREIQLSNELLKMEVKYLKDKCDIMLKMYTIAFQNKPFKEKGVEDSTVKTTHPITKINNPVTLFATTPEE